MKKIMVALIALGMAVVANAASVSWSVTTAKGNVGYDVYLTTLGSFSTLDDVTANLLGSSGNTGVTALSTATARNATATGSVIGLAESSSFDFYYVFVKDNQYWISDKQTVDTNAETAAAATHAFVAASANTLLSGAATGTFAVPEPTSGLLLLLGMAGLALRRKQA